VSVKSPMPYSVTNIIGFIAVSLIFIGGFCLGLLAPEYIVAVPPSVGAFSVVIAAAAAMGAIAIVPYAMLSIIVIAGATPFAVIGTMGSENLAGFVASIITFFVAIGACNLVNVAVDRYQACKGE